jgi:hypothetical protein
MLRPGLERREGSADASSVNASGAAIWSLRLYCNTLDLN